MRGEDTMGKLRELLYPLRVKIIKHNPYGLPIGKTFRGKKKEGNASPFLIEIQGDHVYQMAEDEVEIIKQEGNKDDREKEGKKLLGDNEDREWMYLHGIK